MGYNVVRQKSKVRTYEGGRGFETSDPRVELYLLCANTLMLGENTFYEKGSDRVKRFRSLVQRCSEKPDGMEFVMRLAGYCRHILHLRTVPTLLVTEALQGGYPDAARFAQLVWYRGDEHLESLAWVKFIGQKRTKTLLRAVAHRLNLLTEKQAIKYACSNKSFTQRDAVKLSHPVPHSHKQSALFKYLVHGWDSLDAGEKAELELIASNKAGNWITWEQELSAGSGEEKSQSWENVIPKMGYMALLRNIRNIVQADVDTHVIDYVCNKIADQEEVKNSKQFPYRFLTALTALEEIDAPHEVMRAVTAGLNFSAFNVPSLPGETLLLVDMSGSMFGYGPGIDWVTNAALIAGAFVARNDADVWCYSWEAHRHKFPKGTPLSVAADMIINTPGMRGGTMTEDAIKKALATRSDYDRIILITDEQAHDCPWGRVENWLINGTERHMFVINMAGYGGMGMCEKHPRVHYSAGFNPNAVFDWMIACEVKNPAEAIMKWGK